MTPFDYDASAPHRLEGRARDSVEGVSIRDVIFQSPVGGDVPAYLTVPEGDGPFPAILFLHWGAGDRSEFLSDALLLGRAGVASLLPGAPHTRPGWQPVTFGMDPDAERSFFVQVVVELRRAVDELSGQDFVDASRLAYVGHSLGATVGGAFVAVEDGVSAAVLMGGLPHPMPIPGTGDEMKRRYEDVFSSISSEALIGQAQCDIFFQFARFDRHISQEQAEAYVRAVGRPTEHRRYATSHEFNDGESRRDRLWWIAQALALDADLTAK